MRTEKEIRDKIKHLENLMENPDHRDFAKGAISSLYWILKEKNPYTGVDLASRD